MVEFKHAHRAVPYHGAGFFYDVCEHGGRLRADVENHVVVGHVVDGFGFGCGVCGKFFGADHIGGQRYRAAFGRHFGDDFFRFVNQIRLGQRFADVFALCQQKGVGDAAANDQLIDFVGQVFQHREFGRNLAAGNNRHQRAGGVAQRFAQRVQFVGQQDAGQRQRCGGGNRFGGRLGAVGGAEGVVDEHVGQRGIGFAQRGVIFLFAGVDAHVLQHGDFAGVEFGRAVAPVFEHRYLFAQQGAELAGDGGNVVFGVELAFGRAAEVGHHNHRGAAVEAVADRGQRGADAGVVADAAVFNRHV